MWWILGSLVYAFVGGLSVDAAHPPAIWLVKVALWPWILAAALGMAVGNRISR